MVETCPKDRACSDGRCVPACEAFEALHGSVGCTFLAATPSVMTLYKPGCFAVYVANAWSEPARVSVQRGTQSFEPSAIGRLVGDSADVTTWAPIPDSGVPADQVAVLFLSSDPDANSGDGTDTTCPIQPAVFVPGGAAVYRRDPQAPKIDPAEQTGIGDAFRIEASGPVSLYGMLPFGGARSVDPSATLLYPTAVWGKNYVAVVPPMNSSDEFNMQWAQVLAADDATTVELVPTADLPGGGGLAPAPRGAVARFALNAGQFLQWQDSGELTGTVILADKPIAFYGGASALTYDSSLAECSNGASDNAHQQIPPVAALGHEYVAAPYVSRIAIPEAVPYRMVGLVDGTVLSYDPPQPTAPRTLDRGQVADFVTSAAFTVSSQGGDNPFYVAQFMTGCGLGTPTGDEEFVNVTPTAQYLSKYVFFTDPTYGTTELVLVRKRGSSGFADVEVDCVGTVSGWHDVGTSGQYQVSEVPISRLGVPAGACSNGRHVASSASPFGLVVWGLDNWASYGYPAGGGATTINDIVIVPEPE